nr:MAG TPA: hypothetical protein [Caudoviricetes sp.]
MRKAEGQPHSRHTNQLILMKEITIQGVACPIHFGLRALCDFTKAQNADFESTDPRQKRSALSTPLSRSPSRASTTERGVRTANAATRTAKSGISSTKSRS